jgi:Fe-S oxidoreductase
MSNTGAFTEYSSVINIEAKQAFKEALNGLVGVSYEYVAVSQQVVAGMNYNFFCNTVSATRIPNIGAAIVSIYKPFTGSAHIVRIQEVH